MTDGDLKALHEAGIIDAGKLAEIEKFLAQRTSLPPAAPSARFDLTHVLWYGGALIIIGAMGLFTTEAFNRMGGWALAACGVIYAGALAVLGDHLWFRKNLRIPGGLLIAAAVAMVPMIIYGIQDALDLWKYAQGNPGQYKDFYPYINGSWLYMEIGTVMAALLAMRRYLFPFILMIAAVALWFMSMDLAMWFTSGPGAYDEFSIRRAVSMWFGLATILAAWVWDVVKGRKPDMMFWIHIAGAAAFWGGLSAANSDSEIAKFIYLLINIALLGLSLFIDRRIYAIAGACGVAAYLGHLASDVFKDMIGFSFALSAIGLAVIFAGLWLHKHRAGLSGSLDRALPESLRRLRPSDAA
jgi:hypothetical protein